jgi:ketosteroid isomerase-like protein
MKMRRSMAFFAICSLSYCSMVRQSAPDEDPSATVSALTHAFNDLDAGELRALLSPDATAFLPFATTAARLDGRDAITQAIEPFFAAERARSSQCAPYLALTVKDLRIQKIGREAAIATFDVGNQHVASRRTLVLERRSSRWLIAHLHASNLRPEASYNA